MQNKVGRIRLLNALSDAIIDLKVTLLEIEGVELKHKDTPMTTDGGPGSGNFDHAGRPGEVGGSAPSGSSGGRSSAESKKLYEGIKNEKITKIMEERRRSRYLTFGKTDAEVKQQNEELAREIRKDGGEIVNVVDEALFEPVYHVFHPGMTYQEVGIAERTLNNGTNVGSSRADYIAKCRKAGVVPRFHEVPDEVPEQLLKKTDGTPVYADLSEESQLTDEEIVKYSDNQEKLGEVAKEVLDGWDDTTRQVVNTYTSEYGSNNYRGVNRFLATGEKANEETEKVADIITRALDHEIGADCALFRGVDDFSRESGLEGHDKLLRKIIRGDFSSASQLRDALVGKVVENKHVASTSLRRDASTYGQRPVQIVFRTPAKAKAVNISAASVYGGGAHKAVQALAVAMGQSIEQEDEVAFKPGMRYRIDAVDFSLNTFGKKNRGQVMITATVLTESDAKDRRTVFDGGEGSGNFGHAGRPGEVGGSAPSDSSGGSSTKEKSSGGKKPKPLQNPSPAKSKFSAEQRKKRAREATKHLEDERIFPDVMKTILHREFGEAPDTHVEAFLDASRTTKVELADDDFGPEYDPLSGTIRLSEFSTKRTPSGRKILIGNRDILHEFGHAIDDKNHITQTMVRDGSFQKETTQDVNAFLSEVGDGQYEYDPDRGIINKRTGMEIEEGTEEYRELKLAVSAQIKSAIGFDDALEKAKELGRPLSMQEEGLEAIIMEHGFPTKVVMADMPYDDYRKLASKRSDEISEWEKKNPEKHAKYLEIMQEYAESKILASSVADSIDASMGGLLALSDSFQGHEPSYFRGSVRTQAAEMFANYYEATVYRHKLTTSLYERFFPRLVAEFDRRLEVAFGTGGA